MMPLPTEMASLQEQADELYYRLRPGAINEYNMYILTRTPANLQPAMDAMLAPNEPKLMISDGQLIPVKDAAGVDVPGSPGTARATSQYTGHVELIIPPA